jgi:hypothetical protein
MAASLVLLGVSFLSIGTRSRGEEGVRGQSAVGLQDVALTTPQSWDKLKDLEAAQEEQKEDDDLHEALGAWGDFRWQRMGVHRVAVDGGMDVYGEHPL